MPLQPKAKAEKPYENFTIIMVQLHCYNVIKSGINITILTSMH